MELDENGQDDTLGRIIAMLMYVKDLDDHQIRTVAHVLVHGMLSSLDPELHYASIDAWTKADSGLDVATRRTPHHGEAMREFLGRLRDEFDSLRPWPPGPFAEQPVDEWPAFASAPVLCEIPQWDRYFIARPQPALVEHMGATGPCRAAVVRLRSGDVVSFVAPALPPSDGAAERVAVHLLQGDATSAVRQLRALGRSERNRLVVAATPPPGRTVQPGMDKAQCRTVLNQILYALAYVKPGDYATYAGLTQAMLDRRQLCDGPGIYYEAISRGLEAEDLLREAATPAHFSAANLRTLLEMLRDELDLTRPWRQAPFVWRTIHEAEGFADAPAIARIHRGPVAVAERLWHDFETTLVNGVPTPVLVVQLRSGELVALVADTGNGPPAVTVRLVKGDPATAFRQFRVLSRFGDGDLTPIGEA